MTEGSAGWSSASAAARALGIRREEFVAVAWSFAYFFCLLAAYYMLRSVRETMAIVSGVRSIPWLFTGTFTVMLLATPVFGWVTSRFPRKSFLPWVYYFFIANILIFYAAFSYSQSSNLPQIWIARAFFVWISVFNLFVVSVFWSFMADIYNKEQSRRLFGVISAGGSAGAFLGPLFTSLVAVKIGFENLLPLSALLLLFVVFCVYRLRRWASVNRTDPKKEAVNSSKPIGGSALDGIRFVFTSPFFGAIAMALLIANFLGGATYYYMADLVSQTFEGTDRQTQVFALLDAITNFLSFVGQLFIVRLSVRKLGVGWTLAILPIVSVIGFALLAFNPVFALLAGLQVARRSIGFGLTKPTNDMLYAVVTPQERYKAKNFIDTAVYRGSDAVTGFTVRAIGAVGGLSGLALVCVPLAIIWSSLAFWIGRQYRERDAAINQQAET
jgi:AAA family ATP:ADP antiporter